VGEEGQRLLHSATCTAWHRAVHVAAQPVSAGVPSHAKREIVTDDCWSGGVGGIQSVNLAEALQCRPKLMLGSWPA